MDQETRERFERIERQMASAHVRIDQRPLWAPPTIASPFVSIIISSQCDNTIYTSGAVTLKGIDYDAAVTITSVPNASAAAVTSGFPSGLGKGTIVGTSSQVWVAPKMNDGTTTITDLLQDLPISMCITSRLIGYLPVGATAVLAPVYAPWTW